MSHRAASVTRHKTSESRKERRVLDMGASHIAPCANPVLKAEAQIPQGGAAGLSQTLYALDQTEAHCDHIEPNAHFDWSL